MIESAEKTSTVHQVSLRISEQYRREVDASLAIMVKLIEPIALLMAGVFVMWFAIGCSRELIYYESYTEIKNIWIYPY